MTVNTIQGLEIYLAQVNKLVSSYKQNCLLQDVNQVLLCQSFACDLLRSSADKVINM